MKRPVVPAPPVWDFPSPRTAQLDNGLRVLIFQRPGNVRAMEWAWVDLDAAKIGRAHV